MCFIFSYMKMELNDYLFSTNDEFCSKKSCCLMLENCSIARSRLTRIELCSKIFWSNIARLESCSKFFCSKCYFDRKWSDRNARALKISACSHPYSKAPSSWKYINLLFNFKACYPVPKWRIVRLLKNQLINLFKTGRNNR